MGTLNNYTHLLPLLINVTSASGFKIWNEMLNINRKFCRRNPSKKKQESFLNILETEDSYFKPDEIMCYINSNTAKLKQIVLAVETISLVHLDTQGLFIFYNECLSFSIFFSCVSFNVFFKCIIVILILLSTKSAQNFQNFIFQRNQF